MKPIIEMSKDEVIAEIQKLEGLSLDQMERLAFAGNPFAAEVIRRSHEAVENEILYGTGGPEPKGLLSSDFVRKTK